MFNINKKAMSKENDISINCEIDNDDYIIFTLNADNITIQ